jgi:hypothetical protein
MRDTLEMAREAGNGELFGAMQLAFLERFEALVRADEREACAKECKFDRTSADIEIAIRARGKHEPA